MSANQPPPNAHEIGGVLGRVNRLGTATERMFSRLYRGINRKSALQAEMQNAQRLTEQNRQLQRIVKKRDTEIERLNSILGSIDEGVIMQDNEGRIVVVNQAARNLIGSQKSIQFNGCPESSCHKDAAYQANDLAEEKCQHHGPRRAGNLSICVGYHRRKL